MATIPAAQARAIFTQTFIDVYRERPRVMSFLRSFFPPEEVMTRYLNIEVERGSEKVAADVVRGSLGNRNEFGRSTVKTIDPPLYREYFDATLLALYDRLFGTGGDVDSGYFSAIVSEVADRIGMLQNKIERAYELQASQVLQDGIVVLKNGDAVDYKRKAASKVDKGSGAYWDQATVSPFVDLEAGARFVREQGKSQGDAYNVIMGSAAWSAFQNNTIVQKIADIRRYELASVMPPQRNSTGGSLQGEISIGSYRARIWTYPEVYEDASGNMVPYVNSKYAIMLPESPRFKFGFAAVPQLITPENPVPKKGAFVYGDYIDERKATHEYDVQSCGLAIPTAVDQVYTVKVVQ